MTPKEKAKELVNLYCQLLAIRDYENKEKAKQCAILAVEELINMANLYDIHNAKEPTHIYTFNVVLYWQEVKNEIDKL